MYSLPFPKSTHPVVQVIAPDGAVIAADRPSNTPAHHKPALRAKQENGKTVWTVVTWADPKGACVVFGKLVL